MNLEMLISQPSKYFQHPDEVLKTTELSQRQKIEALKNWKQFCVQLQRSVAEGMVGSNQENQLQDVSNALDQLQHMEKG